MKRLDTVIAAACRTMPNNGWTRYVPGTLLCSAISIAALLIEHTEAALTGRAWLEALVLAILLGTALRTAWTPSEHYRPGITFCAKTVLEVAVMLLGASISLQAVAAAGFELLLGIVGIVVVVVACSYGIGRALGLPARMAMLVAAGNSICGNSAIAAVAPIIGATGADVAASIAFTAVLGVAVVLTLPLAMPLLHMSELQYGVLAGLTVYAVPQVLAATAPVGLVAVQMGTLVKLVRVLMLGPLVTVLSIAVARRNTSTGGAPVRLRVNQVAPWFILGFLVLAGLRSVGVLPLPALPYVAAASNALTILAMAALGVGVNLRTVAKAGPAVTATVTLSLILLIIVSLALIRIIRL